MEKLENMGKQQNQGKKTDKPSIKVNIIPDAQSGIKLEIKPELGNAGNLLAGALSAIGGGKQQSAEGAENAESNQAAAGGINPLVGALAAKAMEAVVSKATTATSQPEGKTTVDAVKAKTEAKNASASSKPVAKPIKKVEGKQRTK